jgi:hypothetical protein
MVALQEWLEKTNQDQGMVMHEEKWKLKFTLKDKRTQPIHCAVNLLAVEDQKLCFEVSRLDGDQMIFMEKFKIIK